MNNNLSNPTLFHKQTPVYKKSAIVTNNIHSEPKMSNIKPFILNKASVMTKNITAPKWIIKDIIPETGLIEIFGASGSFKSFVVLDIAFAIASGERWKGYLTKKGTVIYIAGEGGSGVRKRLRAIEITTGIKEYDMYISEQPMDLFSEKSCSQVANEIKKICNKSTMIIIDTLHRNSTANEDKADDFAQILHNIDTTFKDVTDVVMWVHHSGHTEDKRSRGTSSRYAALDISIKVSRKEKMVTLNINKQKDADEHSPITLSAHAVELGIFDEDYKPVTSLILKETDIVDTSPELSSDEMKFIRLLLEEIAGSNRFKPVLIESIRFKVYDLFNNLANSKLSNEANKKRYQRIRDKLQKNKFLVIEGRTMIIAELFYSKYPNGTHGTQRDNNQLSLKF